MLMPTDQLRFGLMPVLHVARDLPRTVLPLKSVSYQFVVRGGLADVQMTQVYRQENAQPLDCEYLFPLPADAAVYRCEALVNGRVIRARIEEREAARKLAAENQAKGRRTVLVESERENLFTLSLGNVQPEDVVEMTLAYLQPLRRQDRQVCLDLPLCPGVRYIPGRELLRSQRGTGMENDTEQVPDASRISPPRIDADHPDAAFVDLDGWVDATFIEGGVASPTHPLHLAREGQMVQVTLAQGGEVPDRDLALRWQEGEPARASLRGWTCPADSYQYALLELRAPAGLEAVNEVPQDVYFLLDRSGSMQGRKWEQAIQALHGCVGVLGPADRIWVTLFESTFQDFDAEPVTPAALLADRRFRELVSLGTAGGTEMGPALRHVLAKVKQFSQKRPAVLVLLTDAEIGNEGEIVSLMREHPELPVHCFGIDTTLNDSLLLDLVRQQGGTFHPLAPGEDVAGRVTQLGRTLRQAVLVSLHLPEECELAAGAMPNLYAGQIQLVSVRFHQPMESHRLTLTARDHRNLPVSLVFLLDSVSEVSPRLRWCKERLVSLVAKADPAAAIALSRESNLLCPFTAFVAWDDQEKVAVAAHRLVQPALAPEYAAGPLADACISPCFLSAPTRSVGRHRARRGPQGDGVPPESTPIAALAMRIGQFLSATSDLPQSGDWTPDLKSLIDWLKQSPDPAGVALIGQLLDECERLTEEWHRCQERLNQLSSLLADELEHAARTLRKARRSATSRASFCDDVRAALSHASSGSTRQELEATLSEASRLERLMMERIERFFGRRQPPAPRSAGAPVA